VLRRIALLVAVAALLVVMTASFASAQGTTPNPCPPGQFVVGFDPETGEPICATAQEAKKKGPLPPTGGSGSVVPIAASLLIGTGLLTYAVIRRR
jgi:hypothetical protein